MTYLETERLILRDYIMDDLDDLHGLLSDKETMYFLDDITTSTIEETRENLAMAMRNEDGHYFCIREKGGAFVGSIGYTQTAETPVGRIVHMGYFILPRHNNKGYTTEAARRVLRFAFEEDNCARVTTGCYADHAASRRVMEKAGFRMEGKRIKAQWHDGRMKDRLDYAINRDEYYK